LHIGPNGKCYVCTDICFGGANQATAFVTLANSGRLVALDWPHPGLALNC